MRFPPKAFPQAGNERGFTLLELLLVVTILSAVAWMSLAMVGNDADQVRFEDTRNRLQAIRRAIIGDTSRTINGQPEIRGYVADMGRLPANLNELIAQGTQPVYRNYTTYGLWAGWNGPYLRATEVVGSARFQDGWGNRDGSSNFGWKNYSTSAPTGDLTIQSYGRDGVAAGADPYDADFPPAGQPIIHGNEYLVKITGGLQANFGSGLPPVDLCMALAFRSNGTIATMTSSRVEFPWNERFVFEDDLYLGQAAYGIFVWNSGCDPTSQPFPPGATRWTTFTVVPGTVIQPFERKVGN